MNILLKACLAFLILSLAVLALSFSGPAFQDMEPRVFESWVWTVIGVLLIPLMIGATVKLFTGWILPGWVTSSPRPAQDQAARSPSVEKPPDPPAAI